MNANDTAVRNQLSIEALSALLFIKVNGPPPSLFNPIILLLMWSCGYEKGIIRQQTNRLESKVNSRTR